ncbi:MAG: tRNA pseudouridine(13) synthase TruD [Candidatus Woesearchaeota archaeon]|nr:tRNA pseudouridine(13) synthase TruD [Candidatus Woesearchaeota archaeon]
MYRIKQIPEDFAVKEISNIKLKEKGSHGVFLLKKRNCSTPEAIELISHSLNIKNKEIGYAGNKDKEAITEQIVSIKIFNDAFFEKINNLKIKNIELKFLGYSDQPISLGDLEGNSFEIIIRNLDKKEINVFLKNTKMIKSNKLKIPNYYGEQRFSKNNIEIGKLILKNKIKEAIELIIENDGFLKEKINGFLENNKNNYNAALKIIPKRVLRLYIHSYQSFLWNDIVSVFLKNYKNKKNLKIPLIGFGLDLDAVKNPKLKKIIKKTLEAEKINPRDFVLKFLPELSSEGGLRNLFIKIKGFKIIKKEKDELNKNKEKITIKFSLQKGSYATVAVDFLFKKQ